MDNIISIFTGKPPCDGLSMSKEEFDSFYQTCVEEGKNNHDSHIDNCLDCTQRYFVDNRVNMQERIQLFLNALSESLENRND